MYLHHPTEDSEVGSSELGKQQVCSVTCGFAGIFANHVDLILRPSGVLDKGDS
jgi:hypothetical protein